MTLVMPKTSGAPKLRMPCSHRLWVYDGLSVRPDAVVAKIIALTLVRVLRDRNAY